MSFASNPIILALYQGLILPCISIPKYLSKHRAVRPPQHIRGLITLMHPLLRVFSLVDTFSPSSFPLPFLLFWKCQPFPTSFFRVVLVRRTGQDRTVTNTGSSIRTVQYIVEYLVRYVVNKDACPVSRKRYVFDALYILCLLHYIPCRCLNYIHYNALHYLTACCVLSASCSVTW